MELKAEGKLTFDNVFHEPTGYYFLRLHLISGAQQPRVLSRSTRADSARAWLPRPQSTPTRSAFSFATWRPIAPCDSRCVSSRAVVVLTARLPDGCRRRVDVLRD
jgi:hypothetical protein